MTNKNTNADKAAEKSKPVRHTFMLHSPATMESLGKFQSSDYRYAALKVASRQHPVLKATLDSGEDYSRILLRKTNTKEIREFEGRVITLDTPTEVKRGDRTISYSKKPVVKYVNRWIFDNAEAFDTAEDEGETTTTKTHTLPKAHPIAV
jgi:hypothetical protein